jgi:tRNA-dihydrouridine synthase C
MQGYMPPAYWQPIGEVRRQIGIPVIANGEIWTLDDFKRCRDETGCEHFMLGRGALADPRLPLQVAKEMGLLHADLQSDLDFLNWSDLFKRFAEIAQPYTDRPGYVASRLKQWARISHKRFPNSWFDHIKLMKHHQEIIRFLETECVPVL